MLTDTSTWIVSLMLWGLIWFAILFFGSVIYIAYILYQLLSKLRKPKNFYTPSGEYPSRGEEK